MNFLREMAAGFTVMVNGWLSPDPRKSPDARRQPCQAGTASGGQTCRSKEARLAMPAGSGPTLQGGFGFDLRGGLGEPGLQNLVALVAQMRAQDMRQPDAVAALHRIEDRFMLS